MATHVLVYYWHTHTHAHIHCSPLHVHLSSLFLCVLQPQWNLLMFLLGDLNHTFNQSDLGEMARGGRMSREMFVLTRS